MVGMMERDATHEDAEYRRCLAAAMEFVRIHEAIRNRDLRQIADVGYDQATRILSRAVKEGALQRVGSGSGTRYILGMPEDGGQAASSGAC
jgi:predicted HTH transcriptional regulator